jgi:hypothetical protein
VLWEHAVSTGLEPDNGFLRALDQEDGHEEDQVGERERDAEQGGVCAQVRNNAKALVRVRLRQGSFHNASPSVTSNIAKRLRVASMLSE